MLCFFACFFKAYVLSKSPQGDKSNSRLPIPLSVVFAQVTFPLRIRKKNSLVFVCLWVILKARPGPSRCRKSLSLPSGYL